MGCGHYPKADSCSTTAPPWDIPEGHGEGTSSPGAERRAVCPAAHIAQEKWPHGR